MGKPNRSYLIRARAENEYGFGLHSTTLLFKTPKLKKEKEIELEAVKWRKQYNNYHPNNLLDGTSSIYAAPLINSDWGKDCDWIIFRPKNHKKNYMVTSMKIHAR